jgi:hypothetical protein
LDWPKAHKLKVRLCAKPKSMLYYSYYMTYCPHRASPTTYKWPLYKFIVFYATLPITNKWPCHEIFVHHFTYKVRSTRWLSMSSLIYTCTFAHSFSRYTHFTYFIHTHLELLLTWALKCWYCYKYSFPSYLSSSPSSSISLDLQEEPSSFA